MFVRLARGRGRDRRSQFAGITKEKLEEENLFSFFERFLCMISPWQGQGSTKSIRRNHKGDEAKKGLIFFCS